MTLSLRIIALFFLLCSINSHAQNKNLLGLKEPYQDYFELSRETVHLHLNKTTYLAGEEIWFTAYVYNRRNGKPFVETSNLICGLYDKNGKQLTKELLLVENGIAQGHFSTSSKMPAGELYIKATTNWMRNFNEDENSTQVHVLTLLGQETNKISETQEFPRYDLQLLPEGGHAVAGTDTTFGFKATDQYGKGMAVVDGTLFQDNKPILHNISSNTYGLGKFSFNHNENSDYQLELLLTNGSSIVKKLDRPRKKGIAMTVNNLPKDRVVVSLSTDTGTLEEFGDKNLYLAIHRDGLLTLNTFELEDNRKNINIPKDRLLPGINIITLFDPELRPITERLIFNSTGTKIGSVQARKERGNAAKDSVRIRLNIFSKNNSQAHLSVSVLPEDTKAYSHGTSILSSFLIRPYLKGSVENTAHYLENPSRKKSFELDLLLLTQGWSSYDWDQIFKDPPKEVHAFEKGITISGKVTNATYGKDTAIVLYGNNTLQTQMANLGPDTDFTMNAATIIKGDSLGFALIGKKGKTKKPKIALDFAPELKMNSLDISDIMTENKKTLTKRTPELNLKSQDGTIALQEVTVTELKKEKELIRNRRLTVGIYTGRKIAVEDVKKHPVLYSLIKTLGFKISFNRDGSKSILAKVPMLPLPKVVIDGQVVIDPTRQISNVDFISDVLERETRFIDEVYYEHMGLEESPGGTIYIYQKESGFVGQKPVERFVNMLATEGFQRPMEYYNPKYSSYNSKEFLEYGVVHWQGATKSDTDGKTYIQFPTYGLERAKLFIEGMAQDGTLFSETKIVDFY